MAADSGTPFSSSGSWSITDVIFLCYARADRAQVDAIAAALRARGASVWYDAGSAAGSSSYVEASQRALRRSALMLVFLSASALKSSWVVDETRAYRSLMARDPGHSLLAVHLDKTRLPIWLSGVNAIDAHGAAPAEVASQIASVSGLASLAVAPAPSRPAAMAAPAVASSSASVVAPPASRPAPVASGPIYVSYDPADNARVQPLLAALQGQGATVAENGAAGLQQAQTLLVAISSASAGSAAVGDDVSAFHALAANDASRAVIGMHLDQTASPANLNGASAVDAQGLAPDDTARLIVASLPAGGAVAAVVVAEPETSSSNGSAAPIPDMEPETSMPAASAPAMEAEATTVVPPAHDFTDAAHVDAPPAMDAIETGVGAGASMAAMDSAMGGSAPAVDAVAAMAEPSVVDEPPAAVATPAAETALVEAEPAAAAEAAGMTETAPALAAAPPTAPEPVAQPDAVVADLRAEQANSAKQDAMAELAKPVSNTGSIIAMVIIVLILVALTVGLWVSYGMPQ